MTWRGPRLGVMVVMCLALAATLAPALGASGIAQALLEAAQAGQPQCFQETGKCVRGAFLVYWQQHGGLEQFGFPVSDEIVERNAPPPAGDGQDHLVQYFERARFEFHENPGKSQGNVKLGLLGSEQWQARHAANPPPSVQPQALTDPFAFCAQAGTVDYPAWLFQGKVAFTGAVRDPANGAPAGLRCQDSKPLICTPGASDWSCAKVNPSQTPPARTQLYCQIRGQDGGVPGAYVDRTSIYLWTCRGGQAVIDRQVVTDDQVDERGYLKEAWRPLPGGPTTTTQPAAAAAVTGTVTYLERVALAPGSVVRVSLDDVSRADAPAINLGVQAITTTGQQVPIPFAIPYDPATIDPRFTYAVSARITGLDGVLLFITDTRNAVITGGNLTSNIELVLRRV